MAATSPSALLAVQDRPMAERTETRGSVESDGQFAGLMAQLVQKPAASPAPVAPPDRPTALLKARPSRSTPMKPAPAASQSSARVNPGADHPVSKADPAGSRNGPSDPKQGAARTEAAEPKAETTDSKVVDAAPASASPDPKMKDAGPKQVSSDPKQEEQLTPSDAASTSVSAQNQGLADPDAVVPARATLPGPTPLAVAMASGPSTPLEGSAKAEVGAADSAGKTTGVTALPSSDPAPGATLSDPTTQGEAQGAAQRTPALEPQPVAPETRSTVNPSRESSPAVAAEPNPAQPSAAPASPAIALPGPPPVPPTTTVTITAPAAATAALAVDTNAPVAAPMIAPPAQVAPPAEPQAATPSDPSSPPQVFLAKAAMAEPGPRTKESSKADEPAPRVDPGKAAAGSPEKSLKALDAPLLSRDSAQAAGKPFTTPAALLPEQEGLPLGGNSSLTNPADAQTAAILLDALAVKSPAAPQTATPTRAADGSAMAALAAQARPVETTAPQAAAPPPAPVPLRTPPVLQVEGGLRWMLKGDVQEAQLQLHPDSLGQVTIHLRVEGGAVHARLWITEPGSMQAVQEGRSHLEMALKEQGLSLGSFDLQQGHRPHQDTPATPSFREHPALEAPTARQEAPAAIYPTIANPHHVELYA